MIYARLMICAVVLFGLNNLYSMSHSNSRDNLRGSHDKLKRSGSRVFRTGSSDKVGTEGTSPQPMRKSPSQNFTLSPQSTRNNSPAKGRGVFCGSCPPGMSVCQCVPSRPSTPQQPQFCYCPPSQQNCRCGFYK